MELATYTVPSDVKSARPYEIQTLSFGAAATTAAPWGYGELALVSLAVDEPSGVLLVSFPAD